LDTQLRELSAHEPAARAGDDPEAVHQMRVAVRRMRSTLKMTTPVPDPAPRRVREELKWLAAVLGGVRDLDVLIDDLRQAVALLPTTDRSAGLRLVDVFLTEREVARRELLAALDGGRYLALRQEIAALARSRNLDPGIDAHADGGGGPPLEPQLVLRKPYRTLIRAIDAMPEDPADEQLHVLRIHGKRLRYVAELLRPSVGQARVVAATKACRRLQDLLGEHQDAVTAAARIRAVAVAQEDLGVALVAGRIIEQKTIRRAAIRKAWPTAADRVRETFADVVG
jgi:CHAD domain-containing protein